MRTKEGKIFIVSLKKTNNYNQDIHPLLKINNGSLVITHKPMIGSKYIKITQEDVYKVQLKDGFSYITDEVTEHKEGHVIGGIKRNLLSKIIKKFSL